MTSRIATITIDAHEPRTVAEFWASALGWRVVEEEDQMSRSVPTVGR
jgi:hypothetical protein